MSISAIQCEPANINTTFCVILHYCCCNDISHEIIKAKAHPLSDNACFAVDAAKATARRREFEEDGKASS